MYFKRLEMHGFKSFADPVVIEFHEGITCVVGPNGSGKSNISDAIRWVLGEQSPKALRGGKMEEVIFAGTASRKSRGMAEVVLVIDNSSGILNVDYNEVAITRRMYRSGESEYLINNNPCRLRDIRELIMDTGIGVDGYSLIGQGKIADIVSTKPESRREIFEEAAGVVMYKNRRSDAEKKLESTSANLERVDDIVSEIESRIGQLKEDSEKAKEFVELRDKYKDLEINLILRNIANIEKNSEIYRADVAGFESEISKVKEESEALINRYEELTSRRELLDKLSDETRDKIMDAVQRINSAISEGKLSEQRLVGIENESNIINSDIVSINERKLAEEELLSSASEEFDYLSKELENAKLILNEKIAKYNELASRQAEKLAEADDGKRKVFELHNRVSASESESKGYENLKKTLLRRREELEELRDENSEADRQISDSLSGNLQEIEECEARVEKLKLKLSELETSIAKTSANIKDKEEQLARERLEAGRIQTRLHTIEEMESNYEGYNLGVRALMKQNLNGIRGVTAELMDVPKGYELAIETAMGASLQNVICENDEDAKHAVKFLKENRVGRITFLPIASIRASKQAISDKLKDDKGFLGMAVDIISFDK
ncbi:MAG: AAA family ATPase, partial [[Eubacterium] sulci]|nr:AAA family ATPase [[Eubacterium] sulci]